MSFQLNGRHVQRSTKLSNKREAETYERPYRTQLAKGEVGFEPKIEVPTFDSAIVEFLAWVEIEHAAKPNTVRSYKSTSRSLLRFFGAELIDRIQSSQEEQFKLWRSSQKCAPRRHRITTTGATTVKKRKATTALKPATINRELALLEIFFNYYIPKDAITKNPVSRVKPLAENNHGIRVVSTDEEQRYLLAATNHYKISQR